MNVVEYDLDHEDNLIRVKRFPGENTIGKNSNLSSNLFKAPFYTMDYL